MRAESEPSPTSMPRSIMERMRWLARATTTVPATSATERRTARTTDARRRGSVCTAMSMASAMKVSMMMRTPTPMSSDPAAKTQTSTERWRLSLGSS